MNPFTSTTLNYDLVQDRRRTLEDAAARRRLLRFATNPRVARRDVERPPDPAQAATSELTPVLVLVEREAPQVSAMQHLPAAAVSEPTTARVA